MTTYFMAVGTLFTAPSLLGGLPAISPALAATLVGVVLTSVAGQYLLHHGLGFAPATQASLAAATSTVSAAVFEALWLGERLSPHTLAGAALMVAAVALAAGRRRPRPPSFGSEVQRVRLVAAGGAVRRPPPDLPRSRNCSRGRNRDAGRAA